MRGKLHKIKSSTLLRTLLVALLIALVMSTIAVPSGQAATPVNTQQSDAYDFPVKPGTEQWKAFRTHMEMLDACQIPESILHNMSTAGLVETVLNYPLLIDMHAYDNLQSGFTIVADRFNGIPELLSRKDAASELIKKYKMLDLSEINDSWTPLQQGRFVLGTVACIEILLTQDVILNKMSEVESKDLLEAARTNWDIKQQKEYFYGQRSPEINSFIIESITKRGWSAREGVCGWSSSVDTPNDTEVETVLWSTLYCTDLNVAATNAYWTNLYPNATLVGNSTWKYNCHSYAWYYQSTSNTQWMNDPAAYMSDGSYTNAGSWGANRKMFYDSAWGSDYDHSGITAMVWDPVYEYWFQGCQSKWGAAPLMQHLNTYCPYADYYPTISYWQ